MTAIRELLTELNHGCARIQEAYRAQRMDPVAKGMQGELKSFFYLQGKEVLAAFEKHKREFSEAGAGGIADDIFKAGVIKESSIKLKKIIESGTKKTIGLAFDDMNKRFGTTVTLNLKNPRAVKFIAENGAAKVTAINSTTRDYIRTVVKNGIDTGQSYAKTAREIKGRFKEFVFSTGNPEQVIKLAKEQIDRIK